MSICPECKGKGFVELFFSCFPCPCQEKTLETWQEDLIDMRNEGTPLIIFWTQEYGEGGGSFFDCGKWRRPLNEVYKFIERLQAVDWDRFRCVKCAGKLVKVNYGPLIPVEHECSECGKREGTYSACARYIEKEQQ